MNDDLSHAVTILQRKLEEQIQAATETKKVINMLLKSMGKPPQYSDVGESSGIIRADQFYGKGFATAASEYLELRKQACQPEEILRGMMEGGFDFDILGWKESDRLRSLAISLAKNVAKFHRLKNGSFGLRSWYDDDFLKKAAAKKVAEKEDVAYVVSVGDYVQWEPGGILQFTEPKQVVKLSEDGEFAFVEGDDKTGLPIGELVWHEKPKKRGRPPNKVSSQDGNAPAG